MAILTLITGLERAFSGGTQRPLSLSEILLVGAAAVNLIAFATALVGSLRGHVRSLWILLGLSGFGLFVSVAWMALVLLDRAG